MRPGLTYVSHRIVTPVPAMENAPPLADVTWSRPRDLEFIVGPNACTACRGRVTKVTVLASGVGIR
jgi:hypothetical protein